MKLKAEAVFLCVFLLAMKNCAGQLDCIQSCPQAPTLDIDPLPMRTGQHKVLCLNFQYYEPGRKTSDVAAVPVGTDCIEDSHFSMSQQPLDSVTCSMRTVELVNCMFQAVVIQCFVDETTVNDGDSNIEVPDVHDLTLAIRMNSTNLNLTSMIEECVVQVPIHLDSNGCDHVETHEAITDSCSGVSGVVLSTGTNSTVFLFEDTNIASVGRAVLIDEETQFCGTETFDAIPHSAIMCEVAMVNDTLLDLEGSGNMASSTYLTFRCPGDPYRVEAGEARIIFERALTHSASAACESLTETRPYYTQFASVPINWLHEECDEIDSQNFQSCLDTCTSDPLSNEHVCETLTDLLNGDEIGDNYEILSLLLPVLSRLVNSTSVQGLGVYINLFGAMVNVIEANNITLTSNQEMVLISSLDKVLDYDTQWLKLQKKNTTLNSISLLYNSERLLHFMGNQLNNKSRQFEGSNIRASVERVRSELLPTGFYTVYFPIEVDPDQKNKVLIPRELLCARDSTGQADCSSVVASALMYNLSLYLDQVSTGHPTMFANSPLLLLSVPSKANLEFPITTYPIQVHLAPIVTDGIVTSNQSCMFWNFDIQDWSSEGISSSVAPDGSFICNTTHLTSFAVLVSLVPDKNDTNDDAKALRVVSYVGSVISLLCLLLSLVVFIVFGTRLNKGALLYIHINFCLSLCLALFVFIAGIETAVNVFILCKVVAVSLHYLFLCAFCWMLAEGIMLYLLVVRVFGKHTSRWYYLLPLGWGLPIPVVALSVGLKYDFYGTSDFCWLSTEGGTIWAFVGPMLIIIIINLIFLVLTVHSLVRSRKYGGGERRVSQLQLARSAVKSVIILLPLLGLTWVIGVFAVNENTTVFAWLFTILNSLQGFAFFILHVLRNQKVMSVLKKVRCTNKNSSTPKNSSVDGRTSTSNVNNNTLQKVNDKQMMLVKGRSDSQTSTVTNTSTIELPVHMSEA